MGIGQKKQRHTTPVKKATIPVAFREQIWLRENGKVFEAKCPVTWCHNTITVYDFESGHNIPESKGGSTTPENLIPICSRCNKSMGNRYTITEWSALGSGPAVGNGPIVTQSPVAAYNKTTPLTQETSTKPWWLCCGN